jgi:hypothetical protein
VKKRVVRARVTLTIAINAQLLTMLVWSTGQVRDEIQFIISWI